MDIAVIVLAAGHGTRMASETPKVLHKIGAAPLLWHALTATRAADPARTIVVTGYGREAVAASARAFDETIETVVQEEQLGTGHAADQARAALEGFGGDALVIFGDTPFIAPETIARIRAARTEGADLVVLGFQAASPGGYGRLVTEGERLLKIVEAKDATPDELAIDLCNSGIVCAKADVLFDLIAGVTPENAQGEYYLTDIAAIANDRGLSARVVTCDESETLGVNSRADLAAAEAVFQARRRAEALAGGVTLTDPESTYFALDTVIGQDVEIGPQVWFGPGVTVETGAEIKAFCHLEGCHIASGATVGPYARLRPGAEIGGNAKVGNFVEIKEAEIGEGAKVSHLTYIGDASVGKDANIGAGTITCNYDGVFKHRTEIGEGAFIGSNSALVAPVTIGDHAVIGSGAVITSDVPPGDLALARGEQSNRRGIGKRFMDRLRALKAAGKRP